MRVCKWCGESKHCTSTDPAAARDKDNIREVFLYVRYRSRTRQCGHEEMKQAAVEGYPQQLSKRRLEVETTGFCKREATPVMISPVAPGCSVDGLWPGDRRVGRCSGSFNRLRLHVLVGRPSDTHASRLYEEL